MALTKVIGNGLGTLGDGTANDTKIVFDGNAQDYHIGLDDSSDKLVIGKGTALGTTTSMSFDENGIVLKPLQPAFSVHKGGTTQQEFANDGSSVTIAWSTERFDQNGDFASNTFTAPVTGKYLLSLHVRINDMDTVPTYYILNIVTSNQTYRDILDPNFSSDLNYFAHKLTVIADMDANDTAYAVMLQSGGTQQSDIDGGADYTYFSGALLC